MKHLDNTIILGLIDNTLDKCLKVEILEHLDKCDICYLQYSSIKSSYLEIQTSDLSEVPLDLFNSVQKKIIGENESHQVNQKFFYDIISNIKNFINKGFSKQYHFDLKQILLPVIPIILIEYIFFRNTKI